MRLGIFAKTFAGTTPGAVIDQARAAGYSTVQYNMACSGLPAMPDEIPSETAQAVAAAAGGAGVTVAAVSGTYNMIHPDPAVRAAGLRRLDVLARACANLDTGLITLCTGTRDAEDQWRGHPDNDTPEAWRDLIVELERAVTIAETYDIALGIEPELGNVVNSAAKARLLIDHLGSVRLRIVIDPVNLFEVETIDRQRDIVAAAVDLLGDRIVMGHAKDRTATGDFAAAGSGVLDFRHYVRRLVSVGFDGSLVTHGVSAAEAPGVGKFLSGVLDECGVGIVA